MANYEYVIVVIFFIVVGTVDVLSASNNYVKLVETRALYILQK